MSGNGCVRDTHCQLESQETENPEPVCSLLYIIPTQRQPSSRFLWELRDQAWSWTPLPKSCPPLHSAHATPLPWGKGGTTGHFSGWNLCIESVIRLGALLQKWWTFTPSLLPVPPPRPGWHHFLGVCRQVQQPPLTAVTSCIIPGRSILHSPAWTIFSKFPVVDVTHDWKHLFPST